MTTESTADTMQSDDEHAREQQPLSQPSVRPDLGHKQRLVMSKMVLTNFKSYQGSIQIGPFHTNFTSVVGPNGSGKSNVIDALLFVFGFKAKKLRQGKLSDLIHNSKDFPNLDRCSVEIIFKEIIDTDTGFLEIPGSEFSVMRSVKKSTTDTSAYHVDGVLKTYKQVQELLKGFGVDLDHKRFLILQGEVEQIALMKPKGQNENEDGLLEYLEDIIGTNKYKTLIEEALKEFEEANTVFEQEIQKFKIVQKDAMNLEDKSQTAMKYIEWENEKTLLNNRILQLKLKTAEVTIEASRDQINEKRSALDQMKESQSKDLDKVKELEVQIDEIQAKRDELKKISKEQNQNLSKLEKREIEYKETEKFNVQKHKKQLKTIDEEKQKQNQDRTWIGNFSHDVSKQKQESDELKSKLEFEAEKLTEIQTSLGPKTLIYQQQIEEKQKELAPWLAKINTETGTVRVLESEHSLLSEKLEKSKSDLKIAVETESETKELLLTSQTNFKTLTQTLKESKLSKTDLEKQKTKSEKELEKIRQDYLELKSKSHDQKMLAQQQKSSSQVYQKLLIQKQQNSIKGIHARLGDLGTIDKKYDIAITTSCGQLDSIVCERVETAQECIKYLKDHKLGRATFLCLDKISKKDTRKIDTPEGVPRIFDLIDCEDKFKDVFYQALGDTLIAKNLEQANRVAYGKTRYKVVTLDGQVIDKSGTISGGGNRVLKGGMSSQKQETEELLDGVLDESKEKFESKEIEVLKLQEKYEQCCLEYDDLKNQAERLAMEIKSINDSLEDCVNSVRLAKENSVIPDEEKKRIKELEKLLGTHREKLETLQNSSKTIEDELFKLHETIMEIGGVKLRLQNAKVDSINEQILGLQKSIMQLTAEKQTREKHFKKSVDSISKKESEADQLELDIEAKKKEYQEMMSGVEELKVRVKKASDDYELLDDDLKEAKETLSEKMKEGNKIRQAQVEFTAELKKLTLIQQQNEQAIKKYKQELSSLSIQITGFEQEETLIPEFGEMELNEMDLQKLTKEYESLSKNHKGQPPNLAVLNEYKQKIQRMSQHSALVEQSTLARNSKKDTYETLRKTRLEEFMKGFREISLKLKEMYKMITMGGNAELELVDSLDPFSEGVLFSVMPPKKSWKNISNLSGGEKTLSSLALVFALHHFKPTPIYVMDEIDAALDFRNVSIIANYVKQRTKNAQFCIISLRNNMFELADRLVGVYKTRDTSKSITIEPGIMEQAAAGA